MRIAGIIIVKHPAVKPVLGGFICSMKAFCQMQLSSILMDTTRIRPTTICLFRYGNRVLVSEGFDTG